MSNDRYAKILKLFCLGLFILLVAIQANKKFVLDEIDFPTVAQAASQSWVPIYYRGEESKTHIGIYHPPLYIYALAAFVKAFGFSELTVRAFGLLCSLTCLGLLLKIGERLTLNRAASGQLQVVAGALFLLHPYTIANTTLPDIDQTVMPVAILSFILFAVRSLLPTKNIQGSTEKQDLPIRFYLTAGLLFAICLWTKLTTTLALIPLLACLIFICKRSFFAALLSSLWVGLIGGCVFFSTYYLYCFIADLPIHYTFKFLIDSFLKGTNPGATGGPSLLSKIGTNLGYGQSYANWIGASFTGLYFFSIGWLVRRLAFGRVNEQIILLLGLFSLGVTVLYVGLIAPFGGFFKYPFPVFALAVLPVAYCLSHCVQTSDESAPRCKNKSNSAFVIFLIFLAVCLFVSFWYSAFRFGDSSFFGGAPSRSQEVLIAAIVGLIIGFVFVAQSTPKLLSIPTYGFLTVTIGLNLGTSYIQAIASYPTKYDYGQRGMTQASEYLRSVTTSNDSIWSMKDIGFYTHNRYVENYVDVLMSANKDDALKKIQRANEVHKVQFFVVTTGIGQDRYDAYPAIKEALNECCDRVKSYDNYLIYKLK